MAKNNMRMNTIEERLSNLENFTYELADKMKMMQEMLSLTRQSMDNMNMMLHMQQKELESNKKMMRHMPPLQVQHGSDLSEEQRKESVAENDESATLSHNQSQDVAPKAHMHSHAQSHVKHYTRRVV